jgi:hypothetical protein
LLKIAAIKNRVNSKSRQPFQNSIVANEKKSRNLLRQRKRRKKKRKE